MPDIETCATTEVPRPFMDGNKNQSNLVEGSPVFSDATLSPSSATLDDKISQHEYSEGGMKAYLTVFGAFVALFCTFGQMNSFGTYQAWYSVTAIRLKGDFRHRLTIISTTLTKGGPIGQLFDRFGPRALMITGTVLYTFAIMMTSISSQYYQYILAQGILFGLGVGLLFYPSLSSVSTYFSKYRATALGVAAAGSSVGGVVYPIILQRLFMIVGFGWGVRISGLISAACCISAVLTVTALSSLKTSLPCAVSFKTFTDTQYLLLALGSSLVALGLFIPFFYIVSYAEHLSLAPQTTFYVLAVMNAGGVFGRIAPAYLSDTLGRFNLLVPSALLSGISCLTLWMFAHSVGLLMLFAAVYGFFSGAFISVITPCVAQISDIRQIGIRIGVLYSIISFPSLVGGPAAGALLVRAHGSYTGMIAFSGSTVVAGSIFILLARFTIDSRIFARV
ncbi:Riboflavin transporter MCH5 [Hypsizygus marmoreus]|uniref:Riboflavin transporter MCH5 n=1 Tax=Hypsizygus marmoreus TaxID=39966 RepID=A0A369IZU3_HYPMA|nr:Riboflavin transporter MCH5 [Hypsizygus marmoreus]